MTVSHRRRSARCAPSVGATEDDCGRCGSRTEGAEKVRLLALASLPPLCGVEMPKADLRSRFTGVAVSGQAGAPPSVTP